MNNQNSKYESKVKITLSSATVPGSRIVVRFVEGKDNPAFGEVATTSGDLFFQANGVDSGVLSVSSGKAGGELPEAYRAASGVLIRWLREHHVSAATIDLMTGAPMTVTETLPAIIEGLIMGDYQFETYKSNLSARPPIEIELQVMASHKFEHLAARAEIIARAVCGARDWAHEPANVVNPETFAIQAKEIADEHALIFKVLDSQELKELGANALLAVGRGSATPARMVVLEYPGSKADPGQKPVILVGKAITFDTGGYSIKTVEVIKGMKYDKCGGVDVVAAVAAAADLKLDQRVVGIIGVAENSIAGDSYKPDDIVRTLAGKTVEVVTTDAEGRLLLADCLAYAQMSYSPKAIIDVATLTSAIVTSLGRLRAGLFSNDEHLAAALIEAGERTHERLWRMPLDDEYLAALKSDEADLKNTGGKEGPSILAAVFLKQFVDPAIPWAHLDIDGVATTAKDLPYCVKGATGFGVRLILDLLTKLQVQE